MLHVQQLSLTPANEVCVLHNDPESAGTQIFLTVCPEAAATAGLCLLTPGWVIVTVPGDCWWWRACSEGAAEALTNVRDTRYSEFGPNVELQGNEEGAAHKTMFSDT